MLFKAVVTYLPPQELVTFMVSVQGKHARGYHINRLLTWNFAVECRCESWLSSTKRHRLDSTEYVILAE
jgi:hypothetical protein